MNSLTTTHESAQLPHSALEEVEQFAFRVDREAWKLFGSDQRAHDLKSITSRLLQDARQLHLRGEQDTPAMVIVGRVGEGKSWLARCFLNDDSNTAALRREIKSGQNDSDRTDKLIWFGAEQSFEVESGEVFLQTSAEHMLDLGRNYVVGDSPGISDSDTRRQELASKAVRSASIKIVVLSRSNVREGSLQDFVSDIDGALILPVIKFRPSDSENGDPPEDARRDVKDAINNWKSAAPTANILDPIFMPDEGIFGTQEATDLMRRRLKRALGPQLEDIRKLQQTIDQEIRHRLQKAKHEIADNLSDLRSRVGNCLERMEQVTDGLSENLMHELLGEEIVLRAGLRRRFRADLIDRTPQISFPYRSFLGVLSLTAGAWDRLLFTIAGSVPSLAMTLFQSAKNLKDAHSEMAQMKRGVSDRIEKLVQDELHSEVQNFHLSLNTVMQDESEDASRTMNASGSARVYGLDSIEMQSHNILQGAIKKHRGSTLFVWLFALLGTGVFLYLISGPVYAIYHEYVTVHTQAIQNDAGHRDFPKPSWHMLASSFLLSMLPAMLVALISVTWCSHNRRVSMATRRVTTELSETVKNQMANGSFRIELTDPRLDAARFLVSIRSALPQDRGNANSGNSVQSGS